MTKGQTEPPKPIEPPKGVRNRREDKLWARLSPHDLLAALTRRDDFEAYRLINVAEHILEGQINDLCDEDEDEDECPHCGQEKPQDQKGIDPFGLLATESLEDEIENAASILGLIRQCLDDGDHIAAEMLLYDAMLPACPAQTAALYQAAMDCQRPNPQEKENTNV